MPTPAIFDRGRRTNLPPPEPAPDAAPTPVPQAAPPMPAPPKPAPPTQAALTRQRTELDRMADELRRAQAENHDLRNEHRLLLYERTKAADRVLHLKGELARVKQKLRATRSGPAVDPAGNGARFDDPEDQFRHEVFVTWADRIPPAEKQHRPLRPYTLGPDFLGSVAELQGIKRAKIVDVVVEVLTGIASEQTSRQVHPLRASGAGDAPQRVRPDGATAWRVNLQASTPSARRLHYWQLRDATIELSRVVVHDDYQP